MAGPHVHSRPVTAFRKAIQRTMSTFPGFAPQGASPVSDIEPAESAHHSLAYSLQKRLTRLIKQENKLAKTLQAFCDDFASWANKLPLRRSQELVKGVSLVFRERNRGNNIVALEFEKLKVSLAMVHEREKKEMELRKLELKLIRSISESGVKYGKNSSSTTMLQERLEETRCSMAVVQSQLIRSVDSELKEAITSFIDLIRSNSVDMSAAASSFSDWLDSFEDIHLQTYTAGTPMKHVPAESQHAAPKTRPVYSSGQPMPIPSHTPQHRYGAEVRPEVYFREQEPRCRSQHSEHNNSEELGVAPMYGVAIAAAKRPARKESHHFRHLAQPFVGRFALLNTSENWG